VIARTATEVSVIPVMYGLQTAVEVQEDVVDVANVDANVYGFVVPSSVVTAVHATLEQSHT